MKESPTAPEFNKSSLNEYHVKYCILVEKNDLLLSINNGQYVFLKIFF
jgi:hypothetical protein